MRNVFFLLMFNLWLGSCRGRDRMIVGFTTTYAITDFHHWCYEFESRSGRGVQHYVIKFVSYLRQVKGFLRVLRFPPPIKLTATSAVVTYYWLRCIWVMLSLRFLFYFHYIHRNCTQGISMWHFFSPVLRGTSPPLRPSDYQPLSSGRDINWCPVLGKCNA